MGAVFAYQSYISKTKVGLVNYQDFQAARILKARDSEWVSISTLDVSDSGEFDDYDVLVFFGRGLALNDEQLSAANKAKERGVKIIVEAATNPKMDVTSIAGDTLSTVQEYLRHGGGFNYTHMLRYFRYALDGKNFGVDVPVPPKPIDSDVLFHLDENKVFTEVSAYEEFYKTLAAFNPEGKKIALLTSVPGPFNANRDHLDALILELEAAGMQVYPIASFRRRLQLVQEISPDAVILMPHGRMHLGKGEDTINWLKEQNIPLLAPVSVFENYDKWLDNPQGYSSSLLTMNIVLPEIDGAVVPYAINAQFSDENGYQIFKAIPDRLTSFVGLLQHWFDLKDNPAKDKKVAIVYFRGPGKNALVAGGMEVAPSLYNTLKTMKAEGYDLSGLPEDFESFKADLDRQGVVMAPYAQGFLEEFFEKQNPALIPAEDYIMWCENSLAPGMCDRINAQYGEAPGDFMVTRKDGQEYIGVARLQYGNVVVLPQPLPGIGEDTFKLVHGTEKAPPHSYVAPYMWLRDVFKADAVMHYGTHGSLEFTLGKQVALSSYDWADALIGNVPHFYVYTMSNVGEAIIAKRRSYATIMSHLTPPFQEAGLYGDLKSIADLVGDFALVEGPVKEDVRKQINAHIISLDLQQDLELSDEDLQAPLSDWQATVYAPLTEWVETLGQSKISKGLYTLGVPYETSEAEQTTLLMTLDTLTQRYAEVLSLQGKEVPPEPQLREQAKEWVAQRLAGKSSSIMSAELLGQPILDRKLKWQEANKKLDQNDIIRGFISMSEGGKSKAQTTDLSDTELMALTANAIADPDTKEFLLGLQKEQSFEHVSKALDPEAAATAKVLAKVIPAIGRALKQLENPSVRELVTAMQDGDVRSRVFEWINSGELAKRVEEQKKIQFEKKRAEAEDGLGPVLASFNVVSDDWEILTSKVNLLVQYQELIGNDTALIEALNPIFLNEAGVPADQFMKKLSSAVTQSNEALSAARMKEQELASSISVFEQALGQVRHYKDHLLAGAKNEFTTILNALDGGYVEPSTGGDPVLNPSALPTGRNMYSIDAEKTPSLAAWNTGKKMAEALLERHLEETGSYPQKVSFTLWPSEFIHSQGATIAEALYLLGVEPVRDMFGRVQNLKLIPAEELGRPRIDVVVQSAGQLRDLAASRLALLERAVVMAAEAEETAENNYVSKGVQDAEQYLLQQGVAPLQARTGAYRRSFGGVNGAYGTNIMEQVEEGDSWEDASEVANQYLANMGAVYGDSETWGAYQPHLFAAALQNTEIVVQPRSSNTWGALSLDHVYEFMGGLSMAVRQVTGRDPNAYFNDFRNPNKAKIQTLNEAVWSEVRTTLLNPAYIGELAKGGASSAETFAETFRNTYGWNVMKPDAIDDSVWNKLHEVYIKDKNDLNLRDFFEEQNPYALQEMTGVMLETARKGLWAATEEQLSDIAKLHAEMVRDFEAGCGTFTCGNEKLQAFIKTNLGTVLAADYQAAMDAAQIGSNVTSGVVLKKQELKKTKPDTAENQPEQQPQQKTEERLTSDQSESIFKSFNPIWLLLLLLPVGLVLRRVLHAKR